MHVLRSERFGVIWLGAAFLGCLALRLWSHAHPVKVESVQIHDLLFALAQIPASEPALATRMEGQQCPIPPSRGKRHSRNDGFSHHSGDIIVSQLDSAGWVSLGLSPKQAASAMRYSDAVGGIQHRDQLARMRVLPQGWIDHHGPFLRFSQKKVPAPLEDASQLLASGSIVDYEVGKTKVDINRADSLELIEIRGVGPWVAARILQARREWGGFSDLRLLTPALNGWDSLATALQPAFICHAADVVQRCPDTLSLENWLSMPLLGTREAKLLHRAARHHPGQMHGLVHHPALDSLQQKVLSSYLSPCVSNGED